jgi:hypothetical protein
MSARLLHVVEYAVITLVLAGVAWLRGGELGSAFWVLLVAPDIGLVVAPLLGRMPGRGSIPPRAVPIYNLGHTYTIPVLVWLALLFTDIAPWPLLGWLIHISADRALGYGLRGAHGGQALI